MLAPMSMQTEPKARSRTRAMSASGSSPSIRRPGQRALLGAFGRHHQRQPVELAPHDPGSDRVLPGADVGGRSALEDRLAPQREITARRLLQRVTLGGKQQRERFARQGSSVPGVELGAAQLGVASGIDDLGAKQFDLVGGRCRRGPRLNQIAETRHQRHSLTSVARLSAASMLFHRRARLAIDVAPPDTLALVVHLLAACERQLDLHAAVAKIQFCRHQGQSLLDRASDELSDLLPVQQQLPRRLGS